MGITVCFHLIWSQETQVTSRKPFFNNLSGAVTKAIHKSRFLTKPVFLLVNKTSYEYEWKTQIMALKPIINSY